MSTNQANRFRFDGHDLSDQLLVSPTRSLGLDMEDTTVKVPGSPGERFVRSELAPKKIPLKVRMRMAPSDEEAVALFRRRLTDILVTSEPRPLVLRDEPTRYYMAKLTDPGDLDNLTFTGGAEIEFTAYDPIAYGHERTKELEEGTTMIAVGGTWETLPRFELTATGGDLRLTDEVSGRSVHLASAPGAGAKVVVESFGNYEGTVTVDGEYAPIDCDSEFFAIGPGKAVITIAGASGTVSFSERWK